jgi:hypothetical protein
VQVASQNVAKYNNFILVNFLQSRGVKGVIVVLEKAKILITHPIKVSVKPSSFPRDGNKGDNIE